MLNCCETLYTTSLRDFDRIHQLHQDTDFFQSGLEDTGEISSEVGGGHGYEKKVIVEVFKLLLRYIMFT